MRALALLASFALPALVTLDPADVRASASPPRCADVSFTVALAPDAPADNVVYGRLCTRGGAQFKTIQVLLHGAGYDHNYWDFPLRSETHSYMRHATAAGYVTLALDRVGYGQSTRPSGSDLYGLDLHVGAYAVHQIVQELRSGDLVVPGFGHLGHHGERVMLVGFSLGAFIAAIEGATYADVDGVILTGFSHFPGPAGFASFGLAGPACLDPKFAALPCDLDPATGAPIGYLANFPTLPFPVLDFPVGTATRMALFFAPAHVDQDVFDLDVQLRQTFPAAELADIAPTLDPLTGATRDLAVPTLIVNGEDDMLLCDPPGCSVTRNLAFEAPFFPAEAELEVRTVARAAHSINLHHGAPDWFAISREWSDRKVGASARGEAPTASCHP